MLIMSIPRKVQIISSTIRHEIKAKNVKKEPLVYPPYIFPYAVYVNQGRVMSNWSALPIDRDGKSPRASLQAVEAEWARG